MLCWKTSVVRGVVEGLFYSRSQQSSQLFLRETQTVARNAIVEEPILTRAVGPASFLRGIDIGRMENIPLYGYVSTRMKGPPAQLILETETETPEPLLARWRIGLGWSLAWTSDVKARWATDWVRWSQWRELWTQLVREHMRQRKKQELDMRAEVIAGNPRCDRCHRAGRF